MSLENDLLLPCEGKSAPPPTKTTEHLENHFIPPTKAKIKRTYLRRARKLSIDPVEQINPLQSITVILKESGPSETDAIPLPNLKKGSIRDFFRILPTDEDLSSPIRNNNQSSPIPLSSQTIPSSPPSLYSADEKENRPISKKRAPRRLNTKPLIFRDYITADMENQKNVKKSGSEEANKGKTDVAKAAKQSIFKDKIPPIKTACGDEPAYSPGQTGILPRASTAGLSTDATMGSSSRAVNAHSLGVSVENITGIAVDVDLASLPATIQNNKRMLLSSPDVGTFIGDDDAGGSRLGVPTVQNAILASVAPNAGGTGSSVDRTASPVPSITVNASAPIDIPKSRANASSRDASFDQNLGVPTDNDDAVSIRSNASSDGGMFAMSDDECARARPNLSKPVFHGEVIERHEKTEEEMAKIRNGLGVDRRSESPHGRPAYTGPRANNLEDANNLGRGRGRGRNLFGGDGAGSDGGYDDYEDVPHSKRKREESVEAAHAGTSDTHDRKKAKQPKLIQSTLNLVAFGASAEPVVCSVCKYIQSDFSKEEYAAHKKIHEAFVAAISIKGYKFKGAGCPKKVFDTFSRGGDTLELSFLAINTNHAKKWKLLAEKVVKRIEGDLNVSGMELTKNKLWDIIIDDRNLGRSTRASDRQASRFTVFVAIKDNLVVSVVVAERIFEARIVNMRPCNANGKTEFEVGASEGIEYHKLEYTNKVVKATMGVHYVWTHEKARRFGIARRLLEHARENYIPGLVIQRKDVAFTNLTDAGKDFVARFLVPERGAPTGKQWTYHEYAAAA